MATSPSSSRTVISSFLQSMSEPLKVLKLINLAPAENWSFDVSVDSGFNPYISVVMPQAVHKNPIEENLVPEVWFGEPQFRPETRALTISEFGGHHLSPALTNREAILDVLSEETWLGGFAFRDSMASLRLNVLGQSWHFLPEDCTLVSREADHVQLSVGDLTVAVIPAVDTRAFEVRDAVFGSQVPQSLKEFADRIRALGIKSGCVEFGRGWLEAAPMGLVQLTSEAKKVLGDTSILDDSKLQLQSLVARVREAELQRSAAKLNLRKAEALTAAEVFIGETKIGTVPTSEYGTVALIHKIEALGAFPVEVFRTHAWTNADGVDALGDFQIDAMHALAQNIAIEYEFQFASFLAHQHPHEHVGLVVCWSCDEGQLEVTDEPWLHYIDDGLHRIPVLTISDFPELRLVKGGKK